MDYKEFVMAWKANTTLEGVAAALSITKTQASATATKLRNSGVNLPKYTRGGVTQVIDTDALNSLLS